MIGRIKAHNVLNGIRFSIAEFFFIPLVIVPFAIYYLHHAQWAYSLASVGIILNCLTVARIGLQQLADGEKDSGLQQLLDKQKRDDIRLANPHLLMDTLLITLAALLPYFLLAVVIVELLTSGRERKS